MHDESNDDQAQRSEARLSAVLDHLREGLVIATTDGDIFYWNPSAIAMHGLSSMAEGCGRLEEFFETFQLWTPDGLRQLPLQEWPLARIIRGERVEQCELILKRPDQGWQRIVTYSGEVIVASTGEKLIHLSIVDLTAQRRAEAALREREAQLSLFIQHAPAAIAMFDREMRYLAVSQSWKDDFQIKGDVVGRSHYELFPEIPERWRDIHRRCLAGEILTADEDPFVRADGTTQWVKWQTRPWYSSQGEIGGILIATEEITARVRAKRALLENEAMLLAVTNEAQVGLVMVDKNRKYLFANHKYHDIHGFAHENIIGRSVEDVVGPLYVDIKPKLDEAFAGKRVRYDLRSPDPVHGGERVLEVVYQPHMEDVDEPYVVVVIFDVTDRKRVEERLDEQRRVLKSVTDNASVALFIMDERQHCTFMNPAAESLTGFQLRELRGKPLHHAIHHTRPDGSPYPIEECPIDRAFPANDQTRGEDVFIHKSGYFYDVAFTASPVRDPSGRLVGTVIEVRDITQEKRAAQELRQSEARHRQLADALREADSRKDAFLAMLAHELRNPLAPIRTAASVLQKLNHGDPKIQRATEIIARQVSHMVRLVDDLLDVSRIARGKIILQNERIDLIDIIKNVAEDHASAIDHAGLDLHISLPPSPLFVYGDKTRIAQVVSNLLQNATKFTPSGGHVFLNVHKIGGLAAIVVRDTGVGIPPELITQLFQPFVQADSSLDRSKGGLGLGLALAKGITELHGGTIVACSEGKGSGATFQVTLPLIDDRVG